MRVLSKDTVEEGDLVFEVFPQTHFINLAIVIGFTAKMIRVKREYGESLTKPHFLIKITEQQAIEYMNNRYAGFPDQTAYNRCAEIMEIFNELKI